MPVTRPAFMYELQVAAQTRLLGGSTLMGIITGVFEQSPEGQTFPYITYGQHVDGPMYTFGHVNADGLFLLDIFSQQGSDDQCYQILAEVKLLLQTTPTNPPLTLLDYGLAYINYDWSTILKEPDYDVRHMPVRFRVKASEL
jgi:hypothetical protein